MQMPLTELDQRSCSDDEVPGEYQQAFSFDKELSMQTRRESRASQPAVRCPEHGSGASICFLLSQMLFLPDTA